MSYLVGPGAVYLKTIDPTVNDDTGQGYYPGCRWINTTSNQSFTLFDGSAGAAVWRLSTNPGPTAGFGLYFQYAESLGESGNSGTTWLNKVAVATGSVPAGDYRAVWSFTWRTTSSSSTANMRIQIDNTTDVWEQNFPASSSTTGASTQMPGSGMANFALTAGIHDIELDWRKESGSGTLYISQARLEFWKVG